MAETSQLSVNIDSGNTVRSYVPISTRTNQGSSGILVKPYPAVLPVARAASERKRAEGTIIVPPGSSSCVPDDYRGIGMQ